MASRIVVADAGPLHYLVLIGHGDILPALFEKVFVPTKVREELAHSETPALIREWAKNPPQWLEIQTAPIVDEPSIRRLDSGEKAAITLALSLKADLILMDDRAGVAIARTRGFAVVGTLGLLDLAARRKLLTLTEAFSRLKNTNFRYPPEIMQALLAEEEKRKV